MANETNIDIDLDPKKVKKGAQEISEEVNKLAETIDDALGKNAVKSVKKLEEASEQGSNRIKSFFRNLGNEVKEDLKAAFDFGRVMSGLKFGENLKDGLKQVFDMEKAFAKLNTRLQLSGDGLKNFKRQVGSIVSSTGQKLEDILPGVETISSRGNIKDPKQISAIAGILSKVKGTTGEDINAVSEDVIDILKAQGSKINSSTIAKTIDAMQGARVAGAFKTAGEAGSAMREISPYAKQLGLDTRGMAGVTAVASKAGEHGESILKQIMEKGTTIGGQQQLNAVLGQQIFKNGKLDASALGKVDVNRFGNQAIMQEATGLTGANGQDLKLFVEAFKDSMPQFKRVVEGSNETANQFEIASDNLGTSIDKFKENLINSVREVGDSVSTLGHDVLKGNFKNIGKDMKNVGQDLWDNKGALAGGLALTAGVGVVAGGGLRNLFKGVGGGAGMAGDLAIAKGLEKAAGVTPVYVVNAAEINGGGGLANSALSTAGTAAGGGLLATIGSKIMGSSIMGSLVNGGIAAAPYAGVAAAGAAGYGVGTLLNDYTPLGNIGEKIYDMMNPDEIKTAIRDGAHEGMSKASKENKQNQKVIYTNPSKYPNTGGKI